MPVSVSVVIPTYNHEEYVLETLDSVFSQTYSDYEVIVVNDGSPDNTSTVLRPLVESGRIKYFEQENKGQASARNFGVANATGEYIAFVDDDDLWPPDRLDQMIQSAAEAEDSVVVYGVTSFFGDTVRKPLPTVNAPEGDVTDRVHLGTFMPSPGASLIQHDAIKKVGGFDPNLSGADDFDIWIRLAEIGRFKFVNRTVLNYRVHDANDSNDCWKMYVRSRRVIVKNYGIFPRRDFKTWREAWHWLKSTYGEYLRRSADQHAREGRYAMSVLSAFRAVWVRPIAMCRPIRWRWLAKILLGLSPT